MGNNSKILSIQNKSSSEWRKKWYYS